MELYVKAFCVAVLEGLTEFIPVSSTGHMLLLSDAVDFDHPLKDTFVVFIQLGAICAVGGIYFRRYCEIAVLLFSPGQRREAWIRRRFPSVAHFAAAVLPIGVIGLLFYDFIKSRLFGVVPVLWGLSLGGLAMIVVDRACKNFKVREVERITLKQSFWIGMSQVFALCPGVSRSGSTMVAGLLLGVSHKPAADFSFMVAVPVMTMAVGYDLYESRHLIDLDAAGLLAFGFFGALITAFVSVRWFLRVLPRLKLLPFGIYRLLLAGAFAAWLYV